MKGKRWIRPALFTLIGGLLGLGYYTWMGCTDRSCAIGAHPVRSMLYVALIGWLLSIVFEKGRTDKCNT